MKLRDISYCIMISLFGVLPAIAIADDALMLSGFDPLQAGPISYSEAKKTQVTTKHADELFHHAGDPMAGNGGGKVTVVEFFDYRCTHCMAMTPILHAIMSKNPEVRVVYKEYPIRGKLSVYAAKAALAANNQGKFSEFHNALMDCDNLDESKVLSIAKSLGLDTEKLQTDMDSVAIQEEIRQNYQLGREMSVYGTPTFYITNSGDPTYLISGEVEQGYLQNFLAKLSR
jgi:protein-disulfide isomerase